MKKYLRENDTLDGNKKYDRIKLFHDLSIIVKFKENYNLICSNSGQKKINEFCQQFS